MSKKRSSELFKRIATGVFGGIVILSLLFYGGEWGIRLFAWVIALGMIWEFSTITLSNSDLKLKRLLNVVLISLMSANSVDGWRVFTDIEALVVASFVLFGFYLAFVGKFKGNEYKVHVQELAFSALGMVYLGLFPLFLVKLRLLGS